MMQCVELLKTKNTFLVFAFNLIATRDEVTMTTSYIMDVGNNMWLLCKVAMYIC